MVPFVLVVGVVLAWIAVAAVLALGMGRAVAVARARDGHGPVTSSEARASLPRMSLFVSRFRRPQ